MIKFFRKIRQNLLLENKTGKYFKYAVGEIVLVVIGILIALSINNWNENRKNETRRKLLLNNLKIDLEQDLRRLATIDDFLEDRKNYSKLILGYLRQPPSQIDSIKTFLAMERSGYTHTFNPPMPTYTEMQGSGDLSLLNSEELKNALAYYKVFIETNSKIEKANSNVIKEYSKFILEYLDEDYGYLNIKDTVASSYKGLRFDLNEISQDKSIILLLKNVYNKSIVEQRYKRELLKPRIINLIKLIDEQE
jgi:hypothetical protein